MMFQNPMTSLNPVWPIGDQVVGGLAPASRHRPQRGARRRRSTLLRARRHPERRSIRVDDYPHQWSGGMMQRAVIAMAMAGEPKLMLADEPTTALDVTIQDQILSLLMELQRETGMAIILVSHDMSVIAETCDRVAVMYAGRIVETGADRRRSSSAPAHPYTHGPAALDPACSTQAPAGSPPIPGQPPDLSRLGPGCPFAAALRRSPAPNAAPCRSRCGRMRRRTIATACLFPERRRRCSTGRLAS